MYCQYFSLSEPPFSIVPDPHYLFMSERHQEALAHLLYGVRGQGGFVLVTGEVGTGKTTVCKGFLEQLPENTDVAYIINPKLSVVELLETLCDELKIAHQRFRSPKQYIDAINDYLLAAHARGRHTVLMIDEAQNLSPTVLEQIRLLTNLETHEKKLLQIILIGQPELQQLLQQQSLRQLAQRITARYHLEGLDRDEVAAYIKFRLSVAGLHRPLFNSAAIKQVFKHTKGIPRLINLLCDRALLAAYSQEQSQVDAAIVKKAAKEVIYPLSIPDTPQWGGLIRPALTGAGVALAGLILVTALSFQQQSAGDNRLTMPQADTEFVTLSSGTLPATHRENPEAPILEPAITSTPLDLDLGDEVSAQADLAQLWGAPYKNGRGRDFCRQLAAQNFGCVQSSGNWNAFVEYNLPGILKVVTPDQNKGYITVVSVEGSRVTIRQENAARTLMVSELNALWRGEFQIIWPLPPYQSSVIRPGQAATKALWLEESFYKTRQLWTQEAGERSERTIQTTVPDYYDLESAQHFVSLDKTHTLEDQIKWFQLATGLVADGIAGDLTIIRLMQETDTEMRTLSPSIARLLDTE